MDYLLAQRLLISYPETGKAPFNSAMKKTLISLLLAPLLAGCAFRTRIPRTQEAPVYRHASLVQLLRRLSAGSNNLSNVKAEFSAAMTDIHTGRKQTCRGILALARPDRLRMKASKAMLPTLFDLLCDGGDVALFIPREKTVYRRSAGDKTMTSGLPDIGALADVFWGGREKGKPIHFLEVDGPRYVVCSIAHNGEHGVLLRKVFFDRVNLNPVRYRYFNAEGNCVRDIRCSDFLTAEGGEYLIPRRITISAPEHGKIISLRLKDIKINSLLNPGLFTLDIPDGVTTRPLEDYM